MNILQRKRTSGFTIVELMIVVMIISILVALAYPSYVQYARKAKRGEAQQLLLNWAINQEIWRSNNPSYNGTDDLKPSYVRNGVAVYTFTVAAGTGNYTLTATANGDQAEDESRDGTPCDVITLDQNGVKAPAACWD